MFGKSVRVFLTGAARDEHAALDETLLASFRRKKELLKENPQLGDPIRKQLIPKTFKKAGTGNLYRLELAKYWRLLYTVEGKNEGIFVFILRILDHKAYDKLFGYKKR